MLTVTLISTGLIACIIYLSPLVKSKLNIGNIFGLLSGIYLVYLGIFFKCLSNIYILKIVTVIATVLYTIVVVSVYGLMVIIFINSKKTAVNEDVVIVLGCRVKGNKPSRALFERCKAAIKHIQENDNAVAILSGGQGNDELISEAECMKRIFNEYGINDNRLFMEDKSTSTIENLRFSKSLIEEHKLGNSIAVATSEYHIFRTSILAKNTGLNIKAIPAKSLPIVRIAYYAREAIGIIYTKAKSIRKP